MPRFARVVTTLSTQVLLLTAQIMPGRYADNDTKDKAQDPQVESNGIRRSIPYAQAIAGDGPSQVSLQYIPQPIEVLDDERFIKSILMP